MRITKVEYTSGYQLKLTFGNKEVKVVDLSEKVKNAKGIFLPLKDLEYFKKVTIDDCQLSICWPNGADICPDLLYSMGQSVTPRKSSLPGQKRKMMAPKRVNRSKPRTKIR